MLKKSTSPPANAMSLVSLQLKRILMWPFCEPGLENSWETDSIFPLRPLFLNISSSLKLGIKLRFTKRATAGYNLVGRETELKTLLLSGPAFASRMDLARSRSAGSVRRTKILSSFCLTEAGTGPPQVEPRSSSTPAREMRSAGLADEA